MRILILGATGRTGSCLVSEALEQGYSVNVLVRNAAAYGENSPIAGNSSITVFEGVPTDKPALAVAMHGCQAVITALNVSRTSDFPWAKLRTPHDFLSATMKYIIELANEQDIKRIVAVSAWGTSETKKDLPFWFRLLIDRSNIGYAYRDHELQEQLLKASPLDWTIVRPVGLTNATTPGLVKVSIGNKPKPGLTISRQSVARFIIGILANGLYFREIPTVSAG